MEVTYTRNPHLSISPRDCSFPQLTTDYKDKNNVSEEPEAKAYYDRLSQFKFPKGPTKLLRLDSVKSMQSLNGSPPQLNPRSRFSSHVRSRPVSFSSTDSIFSSQDPLFTNKKIEFDASRRTSHLGSTDIPIIDLDIASKPLTPRKNVECKFQLQNDSLSCFKSRKNSIIEEDEILEEESKPDSTIMMDFLREDMSDRAMSVSNDYNPLDYVKLNKTVWIDGVEKHKENTHISLFNEN